MVLIHRSGLVWGSMSPARLPRGTREGQRRADQTFTEPSMMSSPEQAREMRRAVSGSVKYTKWARIADR